MGYFQVRYYSGVVIYDHRGFIRLATGCFKYIWLFEDVVLVGSSLFYFTFLHSFTTCFFGTFELCSLKASGSLKNEQLNINILKNNTRLKFDQ